MKGMEKLYLEKAENELILAELIFKVSSRKKLKSQFNIDNEETFYSAVITHTYYSIFYCAKAYLVSKKIKTASPNEHKKTYLKFMQFVRNGILDKELIKIYNDELFKADSLLHIFGKEKKKRALFTYKKLPQANKVPANNSVENANKFFKTIYGILESS